jgi:hypothetical protein
MNRFARICLIAAAVAVSPFGTGVVLGAGAPTDIWLANETVARDVTLPPSDPGILTITRRCEDTRCPPPISAMTTAKTVYVLDKQVTTVAQLRSVFASYPDTAVLVELDADRMHVTRVHMWPPRVRTPVNGPARVR